LLKLRASATVRKYRRCRNSVMSSTMPKKHSSAKNVVLGDFAQRE
jgi:hypothetical protein